MSGKYEMKSENTKELDQRYRENTNLKLKNHGVSLFGVANLKGLSAPLDANGNEFPRAISFAINMDPEIMMSIQNGPNQAYADEFASVNIRLNDIVSMIESEILQMNFMALAIEPSTASDPDNFRADFPHKTAATRAGLGWIGKNCLLITKKHGPWVRLATVFTDLPLLCDKPLTESHCGKCAKCVEACPSGALVGNKWQPGTSREEIVNVSKCDKWKKERYFQFQNGQCCGICAAVCPFGK